MFYRVYKGILIQPIFKNFALKVLSVSEFLISFGKIPKKIGAKKETDLVQYLTEFTLHMFITS